MKKLLLLLLIAIATLFSCTTEPAHNIGDYLCSTGGTNPEFLYFP